MPDPTPTKCSNANYNTAYPVLQSKLLWVQLCPLQITARCPGRSCYDSADCDPVTSRSFSQGLVTEGRMVRALLSCWLPSGPAWKAPALIAASTRGKACPLLCCDTSQADRLALAHMSFNKKGWT